jgi:hypothetical protein
MFVEPKMLENGQSSLEAALESITFCSLPKCFFMSLIIPEQCNCTLPNSIVIKGHKYNINSIIFFIPSQMHYISALRGCHKMKNLEGEEIEAQGWFLANDHVVTFIPLENFGQYVRHCYPTLISFEVEA